MKRLFFFLLKLAGCQRGHGLGASMSSLRNYFALHDMSHLTWALNLNAALTMTHSLKTEYNTVFRVVLTEQFKMTRNTMATDKESADGLWRIKVQRHKDFLLQIHGNESKMYELHEVCQVSWKLMYKISYNHVSSMLSLNFFFCFPFYLPVI